MNTNIMLHLTKMKKSEKAKIVIKILDQFYPETPIPLNHDNVYTLLIAVLLSAQCTDERVRGALNMHSGSEHYCVRLTAPTLPSETREVPEGGGTP